MAHGGSCTIRHTHFCNEPAVEGTNGILRMTVVPNWGGTLISLYHIGKQLELLRVPSSYDAYARDRCVYGMPVLFPPNRIADGTFTFNNHSYQFDITEPALNNHEHGLVIGEAWDTPIGAITRKSVSISTGISSSGRANLLAQFPHHFRITSTYTLRGNRLEVKTKVSNLGHDPFPWGLGYHTTFRLPLKDDTGEPGDACAFKANVGHQWLLNSRFLPTGEISLGTITRSIREGMPVNACPLDDIFSVDSGPNEVTLIDSHAGVGITYDCDNTFKFWVFYNDDGNHGYLSTEPYTWVTNAPNLPLPPEITGLSVLQPGDEVILSSSITVFDL